MALIKGRLKKLFPKIPENEIPIIPLIIGEERKTMNICERLLKEGIFIQGLRPPTVHPGSSHLRLTVMATHTEEQLNRACVVIERIFERLNYSS